jgi:carbamoyltransferase
MGMSAFGNPNDDVVNLLKEYYNSFDSFTQEEQRIMRQTFNKVVWEGFRFNVKEEERIAQHMNLPGSPDMTYNLVKDFFVNYKRLISKISDYDTAASIQKFTEDKIYELMVHARQYGSKLVYSGGVAQNIVANSKIRDLFDDVHIAIAPSDGGSALGCASKSWSEQTGGTHLKWSPYLGYNIKKDINPKKVVDYLMKNKVCGVANGRAEYGQRALGNRSLLGDVRYDIKDTINKIKQRELFRPFAPAILEEYADEYFDGHKNEYMQYTCNAKHDYKSVIHVDGTSRCQVVKKDCQSVIRPILEEYFERTGIPMLLNTSLNIKGQPILNDEKDVENWEKKYKVRIF